MTVVTSITSPPATGGSFGAVTPDSTQQFGTMSVPYQQTSKPDGTINIMMQTITAMSMYEEKSLEELRYEDHLARKLCNSCPQQSVSAPPFGGTGTWSPSNDIFRGPWKPFSPGSAPNSTTGGDTGGLPVRRRVKPYFGTTFVPATATTGAPFGLPTASTSLDPRAPSCIASSTNIDATPLLTLDERLQVINTKIRVLKLMTTGHERDQLLKKLYDDMEKMNI
jgi:hypothetical protein